MKNVEVKDDNRALVDGAYLRGSSCEVCVLNPMNVTPCAYWMNCPFDLQVQSESFLDGDDDAK